MFSRLFADSLFYYATIRALPLWPDPTCPRICLRARQEKRRKTQVVTLIEKILVEEHRSYAKNRFFWRNVTALFGKGLLTSEGELWQGQRHLAAPSSPSAHGSAVLFPGSPPCSK
jgi:hypothetical protein